MAKDLLEETVRLLKKRKISQRAVAAGAGVSQKWVSLLENGEATNPSYSRLVRLRDYLKGQRQSHGMAA